MFTDINAHARRIQPPRAHVISMYIVNGGGCFPIRLCLIVLVLDCEGQIAKKRERHSANSGKCLTMSVILYLSVEACRFISLGS